MKGGGWVGWGIRMIFLKGAQEVVRFATKDFTARKRFAFERDKILRD